MATVFTKIISGELPGRFVWRDDTCVAFLSINPIRPGHTLVVPRTEVDHWIDVDAGTWRHLADVAQTVGAALDAAFDAPRVGVMLAGFEVPHCHIHLVPIANEGELDFGLAERDPDPEGLDAAAERIRAALHAAGASGVSA